MAKFKIGDRWSRDFDYTGMLKAGAKAKVSDGHVKLEKLFRSFEDVNYHRISEPLWDAIELIEKRKPASTKLKTFNKNCSDALKNLDD